MIFGAYTIPGCSTHFAADFSTFRSIFLSENGKKQMFFQKQWESLGIGRNVPITPSLNKYSMNSANNPGMGQYGTFKSSLQDHSSHLGHLADYPFGSVKVGLGTLHWQGSMEIAYISIMSVCKTLYKTMNIWNFESMHSWFYFFLCHLPSSRLVVLVVGTMKTHIQLVSAACICILI